MGVEEMKENHTEADISNFMIKEVKPEQKRERHFILETVLNACIEISSMADFISDLVILKALCNSPDTAWFSFSLFTMLCPYYTVYTSLMTFHIQQTTKRIEEGGNYNCCSKIVGALSILPTMLVILIILDVFFMVLACSTLPFLILFTFIPTVGRRLFDCYEHFENNLH